jgi:hypothetical protein
MADAGRRTITTAACMHNRPTAYQTRSNLKRVFLLIGVVVVLAMLAGGYFAFWRHVAQQLEAGVGAWAGEQRALGNEVTFAWDGIGGFPFRFAATFRDPEIRWRGPHEEGSWTGATLHAEMAPWNLRQIEVRSDGQHSASLQLAGDPAAWRVTTTGLAGTIDLYNSGLLRGFTLALQQPDVTLPDGTALASAAATIALDQPETAPTDFNMTLARVTADFRGTALPPGTRVVTQDAIETLSFDATIKGPMPLAPLKDALAAWRTAGGVVELNGFAFTQGPLSVAGSGTLALDAALQPEGAGTITTTGLSEALEILIRDGLIPADRALIARTTVKALEKPGPDGRMQAKVGLSLQNRTVSFGPVPLLALQPIVWP